MPIAFATTTVPKMASRTLKTDIAVGLKTVSEIPNPISLPVTGTLPSYLARSTLYRNGPGRYEATYADGKPYTIRHWFDGFALVHAFSIDAQANTVHYRNRFTSAAAIRSIENTTKSRHADYSFANDDPCRSLLSKFFQLFVAKLPVDPISGKIPSNCNVTIQTIPGKGKIVARTDTSANAVLDLETLEVDHFFRFSQLNSELSGPFSASHGHLDEDTGDFLNFNYRVNGRGPVTYKVFRIDKNGETEVLASFEEHPRYLHSFATTQNYVIMCLWPLKLDAIKLMLNKSVASSMDFHPELPTKFVVVSRHERRVVATYESPSFYCFHTINAFERNDAIHIDLSKYKDANVIQQLSLDHLFSTSDISPSSVVRFSLDGISTAGSKDVAGKARETVLSDKPFELPRVHPDLLRKDYQFAYGVSNSPGELFNLVAKLDVKTGERVTWSGGRGVVGEPIFVPDPNGTAEDDGALLVVLLDCEKQKSDMVVLDAKTMCEIARAGVPQVVPLGFHGKFNRAIN